MQCHPDNYRIYNQGHFDSLHYSLTTKYYSRQTYVDKINTCWGLINPIYHPGLQRRKDRRTLGQFALQVYDTSVREYYLVNEWLKSIGREDVRLTDYGVANDGRLVLDSSGESAKPDYILTSGKGEWPLDVKFCPVSYKLTFKVHDLKNYARHDALVLLIMGNIKMIGPNGDPTSERPLCLPPKLKWSLFGRKTIRKMLKDIPIKLHREVGNKPSVQLKDRKIGEFFKLREWNYDNNQSIVSLVS